MHYYGTMNIDVPVDIANFLIHQDVTKNVSKSFYAQCVCKYSRMIQKLSQIINGEPHSYFKVTLACDCNFIY